MKRILRELYEAADSPTDGGGEQFSVVFVPQTPRYLIGKDKCGMACLLVTTRTTETAPPGIRLVNLDAQFDVRCAVRPPGGQARDGVFSVIRCRSTEVRLTSYFLAVCESLIDLVGHDPTSQQLFEGVNRLASIFQQLRRPGSRSITGLFGELLFINRSPDIQAAIGAWRVTSTARFDFSFTDCRIDVKTTTTRTRSHIFSYDQCNPPRGALVIAVSLFTEQLPNGRSLGSLIDSIEKQIAAHPDLVFRLHEGVSDALGSDYSSAIEVQFDERLAETSIRYFDMNNVPAIRGVLPVGVSDVHFRANLSIASEIEPSELHMRCDSLQRVIAR